MKITIEISPEELVALYKALPDLHTVVSQKTETTHEEDVAPQTRVTDEESQHEEADGTPLSEVIAGVPHETKSQTEAVETLENKLMKVVDKMRTEGSWDNVVERFHDPIEMAFHPINRCIQQHEHSKIQTAGIIPPRTVENPELMKKIENSCLHPSYSLQRHQRIEQTRTQKPLPSDFKYTPPPPPKVSFQVSHMIPIEPGTEVTETPSELAKAMAKNQADAPPVMVCPGVYWANVADKFVDKVAPLAHSHI